MRYINASFINIFRRRRSRNAAGSFNRGRCNIVLYVTLLIFPIIGIRAFLIQIFPPSSENLQAIAKRQYSRHLDMSPYRGTIFDRRKAPLAISIKKPSLFVNPRIFSPDKAETRKLAGLLNISVKSIDQITSRTNYFAWLKRKINDDTAQKIMALNIQGLYNVMEPARYYPFGSSAAHLIGYAGLDNKGLLGLERRFDERLRGNELKISNSRDAKGEPVVLKSNSAAPEKTGNNIQLTIDMALQEIAEKALASGVALAKATAGFAIVSDPHTGRILAVANQPSFDPNYRSKINYKNTRNRALSDVYEPGSVVKPFVIAEALAEKKIGITDVHFCDNGLYRNGSIRIRDTHGYGDMTTEEVLIHSSNICTFKIADRLGPEGLYNAFKKFGFATNESLIDFPGQNTGRLSAWKGWRPIRFANVSFGQGFTSTGLELVGAYGAIANGGNLMKPYIVDRIESSERNVIISQTSQIGRRVLTPELAKTLRTVLKQVVEVGTGGNAKMAEYTSAGKTGTSEKVDPTTKKYSKDKRIASFIGFTPVDDPHLVIYVVVDEPGIKPYYGGTWAAPIWREIALNSLKYLNVAHDKVYIPVKDNRMSKSAAPSSLPF